MFSWQSAIDRHPRSGRQRIHEFARKGNWKWVRKLINQGASVNSLDRFGFTALHHAVLSTDLQTVLMCLPRDSPIGEATAITHVARDRTTALHLATKLGMVKAAHAIIDYADWMVECGVMEVWERQALLDARTLDGKTALAIATIRGSLQIVSHLGACGAAADTPDAVTGSAPVHWAERMNDKSSMRLLLAQARTSTPSTAPAAGRYRSWRCSRSSVASAATTSVPLTSPNLRTSAAPSSWTRATSSSSS